MAPGAPSPKGESAANDNDDAATFLLPSPCRAPRRCRTWFRLTALLQRRQQDSSQQKDRPRKRPRKRHFPENTVPSRPSPRRQPPPRPPRRSAATVPRLLFPQQQVQPRAPARATFLLPRPLPRRQQAPKPVADRPFRRSPAKRCRLPPLPLSLEAPTMSGTSLPCRPCYPDVSAVTAHFLAESALGPCDPGADMADSDIVSRPLPLPSTARLGR